MACWYDSMANEQCMGIAFKSRLFGEKFSIRWTLHSRQLCWQGYHAVDPAARVTLRTVHQLYVTSAPTSTPMWRETTCVTTACVGSWLQSAAQSAVQAHDHIWTDTIHLSKSAFKSNSDREEREQCWCGIVHMWFDKTIAKNQNIDFGQDSCMEDFGCQFDVYRMRPWVNLVTVIHKLRTRVMLETIIGRSLTCINLPNACLRDTTWHLSNPKSHFYF